MAKAKIKSIEQRGEYWHIRYGKTHIEIPGKTKAALRQWIRGQIEDSGDFAVIVILAAILKQDSELTNISSLVGKTAVLDLLGNRNSVDGIVRLE